MGSILFVFFPWFSFFQSFVFFLVYVYMCVLSYPLRFLAAGYEMQHNGCMLAGVGSNLIPLEVSLSISASEYTYSPLHPGSDGRARV